MDDEHLREILAQEYERETGNKSAEFIRLTKYRGVVSVDLAIAAMRRAWAHDEVKKPKFDNCSCSQCGKDFGPGEHGFSHCDSHVGLTGTGNFLRQFDGAPIFARGFGGLEI